jgi:hypothetical protein
MNRPWPEIIAVYDGIEGASPGLRAMFELANYISTSPLSKGLFGWMSMFDLYIVQTEVSYPYGGPRLRVSLRHNGLIEFRYIDTQDEAKQWHRVVEPADVIERLTKFLTQLRWFSSPTVK